MPYIYYGYGMAFYSTLRSKEKLTLWSAQTPKKYLLDG